MNARNTRRRFLEDSMFATASAVASSTGASLAGGVAEAKPSPRPADRLGVAVVGVRGRGNSHISAYATRRDTRILCVCDPDERVGEKRAREAARRQGGSPVAHICDFREALDDPRIDIISIATPNHWQAVAANWAMEAGKDVYVELPGSFCVQEGRTLIETAHRRKRICQVGLQCRSNSGLREAIAYLHSGALGAVTSAQGVTHRQRNAIGPRTDIEPPRYLNYELWLGPAPIAPVTRQRFHHDWRWLWDYGGGELAGNAIHQLDIARWGLNCSRHPQRILSFGGRFGESDCGETANAQTALHDFGDRQLLFEVRCERERKRREQKVGVIFTAEDGYLVVASHSSAVAFNRDGEKIRTFAGRGDHFANFIHAVRTRQQMDQTADAGVAHHSGALCHLANISYRLGHRTACDNVTAAVEQAGFAAFDELIDQSLSELSAQGFERELMLGPALEFDTREERFVDHDEANQLLARSYRAPYSMKYKG